MKRLGVLSFFILVFTFSNAFANRIHSYQELESAMRAGDHFVILLDLSKCTGQPNMPIGYFTPSKMMLIPKTAVSLERIMTSDLHFTDYPGSPIYEYTKYTFNSDNSVVIRTVAYDPLTFEAIGIERVINCALDRGIELSNTNRLANE